MNEEERKRANNITKPLVLIFFDLCNEAENRCGKIIDTSSYKNKGKTTQK